MAEKKNIPNVLSSRYASAELANIWSAEHKIILERKLWIAVMHAQKNLGVDIPAKAISAYEAVIEDVNLESIAERERVTRHDVKARIEEFNALAGHEHIHKGMTSRDLTENVEQLQVVRSLELVRDRGVAAARRLAPAGPRLSRREAGAVVESVRYQANAAVDHVHAITGLEAARNLHDSEVLVVDRAGWSRANAQTFAFLLNRLLLEQAAGVPVAAGEVDQLGLLDRGGDRDLQPGRRLLGEQLGVGTAREHLDGEALGVGLDDLQSLGADRPGRPEQGDARAHAPPSRRLESMASRRASRWARRISASRWRRCSSGVSIASSGTRRVLPSASTATKTR